MGEEVVVGAAVGEHGDVDTFRRAQRGDSLELGLILKIHTTHTARLSKFRGPRLHFAGSVR